jgi:Ca2+-binding EF-hand superfamily protein
MLIRTAIVAATLAALPAGAVLAQAKTTPAKSVSAADARIDLLFAERDADKDGRITREELVAYRTKQFSDADANKDGVLDSAELAAAMAARMAKNIEARFAAFDKNKDGKLTLDETPGRAKRRFFRADANHDGALSVDEMKKAAERRRGRRLAFVFFRADVDRDGKISKNEFIDAANRFFRRFDRNNDKTVTREEVAAVLAKFDRRRMARHGRWRRHGHRDGHMMGPRNRGGWHHRRRHHMRDGDWRGMRRGMMHERARMRRGRRHDRDDDRRTE